jgi:gentisate 1,2-dioxygenase
LDDTASNTERTIRENFYAKIDAYNLAPLWERVHSSVTSGPNSPAKPAHWSYDDEVRPFLMQAGGLITAKEATRRVLILENPGLRGRASITQSLFAGLQLILPGEVAPAHRHTQSALRFIIEGKGAYTAVEGERAVMEPGDFVITPNWAWHDHGNETDQPMVWMDGLDTPIIRLLDANFTEMADADRHELNRPAGDSLARYGANMLPVDWQPISRNSPVFTYPYARSRETLMTMARNGDPDPCHGHKMRFISPASGDAPMPTIGAFPPLYRLCRLLTGTVPS